MNTFPSGYKRAISQHDHQLWNSKNYPGTRQLCCECSEQTGRCEEDSLYIENNGPFCEQCFEEYEGINL